ncbi:hypothetical protein I2992_24155 [Escherichia coli]|nr:hypothetical protein [Escherichia coli]
MSAARTDGFIRNIHSRNPFDVIRADVVISRLEKRKRQRSTVLTLIYW